METTLVTFQIPIKTKNVLIELSSKRKQAKLPNSSMKDIIIELIDIGLKNLHNQSEQT